MDELEEKIIELSHLLHAETGDSNSFQGILLSDKAKEKFVTHLILKWKPPARPMGEFIKGYDTFAGVKLL